MTNHNDSESPTHKPDICIYYSVPIFQYVLMFHYFQFIRLLNARNCFIITFSFNNFIHELTVWFKDASWYKYLAHRNGLFLGVSMGSWVFFIWIPQVHSIWFLTADNNFIFVKYGIFIRRKLRSDGIFISPCELN